MKFFRLILFFYILTLPAWAQPQATSFTVNGLKVIFKPTQKETISVSMFYRGGVTNYSAGQAGLENLTLYAATQCGTKKYKEDAFRDMADEFGIRLGGNSEYDYGTIQMNCVRDYFSQGWNLFSEAVLNPTFSAPQLELQKERMLAAIRNEAAEPDERLAQLAMRVAFNGTPYATDPLGSEENIMRFTSDSVKNYYYRKLLNKNRMFLVIAGNLKKEDLEQKIKESFSSLPTQAFSPVTYTNPVFEDSRLLTEQRDLATNYFCGVFNAPTMSSPDFPAYLLSINALSGRIFNEVRNHQNLSYESGADLKILQMPYSTMYVSTTNPKAAYNAMINEFSRMKSSQVTPDLLDLLKRSVKKSYYRRQENASYLVEQLGEAEVMGSWQLAEDLLAKVDQVTAKDMYEAFQKYTKGIRWAYLGNKQQAQGAFN